MLAPSSSTPAKSRSPSLRPLSPPAPIPAALETAPIAPAHDMLPAERRRQVSAPVAGPSDTPSRNPPGTPPPRLSSPHQQRRPPHACSSAFPPSADAGPSSPSCLARAASPAAAAPSAPPPPPPRAKAKGGKNTSTLPPPVPLPPSIARPYCFFPLNNNPRHSEVREPEPLPDNLIVHPDDDPGATWGIPIFKPTYDEFKHFDVYMERVRPWGEKSGIVKIIPPKEWVDAVELLDKRAMSQLEIKSPIEQRMKGQNGVFVQLNVERNRTTPLSIHDWFRKCQSHPDLCTPNPKEGDRSLNRDSKEAREFVAQQLARLKAEKQAKRDKAAKRKEDKARERQRAEAMAEDANGAPADGNAAPEQSQITYDRSSTAEASSAAGGRHDAATPSTAPPGDTSMEHPDDLPGLDTSSHTSHSTGEPLATTPRSDPIVEPPLDPFYDLDWKRVWLPKGINPDDYDVAGCSRIEHKFWRSLGTGKKDSWYGADLAGSLFADDEYPWNVAHLPNLLSRLRGKIPGVNSPYLYFGMWRAAFSWHVEDMDLYSINYIHFGAPKLWYAVPQIEAERFESLVRSYFPSDANGCDQFMRHKSCTVSPFKLHSEGIRVNKLVHHQNEFVITFPRGYHAGFNLGFNCAESVNFALPGWVDMGRKAKACTCVDFSVRIDVDILTGAKERSPTPEPAPEPLRRKRKPEDGEPRAKRKRKDEQQQQQRSPTPVKLEIPLPSPEQVVTGSPVVTVSPVVPMSPVPKAATTRQTPPNPCVLCPSLSTEDLAPVFQPNDYIRTLSKTTAVQAHVSCAEALPEAYIEVVTIALDSGEDEHTVTYIKGLENIDKARWNLKCSCCVDKRLAKMGTKVQCTKGKCTRAFHIPCAKNNDEVYYYAGPPAPPAVPPATADGVTAEGALLSTAEGAAAPDEFIVELLCPTHNPAAIETKKCKAAELLRSKVLALEPGAPVKFKSKGAIWHAQLLETRPETKKVVVRMADMTSEEVGWAALDFRPTRPSAPQVVENEYARPPQRSRKAPPELIDPATAAFVSPNPAAQFFGAPQMFPPGPANTVRLVDSKLPPQFDALDSQVPLSIDQMRGGFPPAIAYGPRAAMAVARSPVHSYSPLAAHHHPLAPSPATRMMSAGGPPHPNGSGGGPEPVGRGSSSVPNAPPRAPPPTIPGGVGRIDLGLDRMRALMNKLPRMTVPALHLAGTNGKGSVSVLLESCLNAAGMSTARYNSPHLIEPRDAVRINGHPVRADEYAAAVAHVQRASDENDLQATTFEIGTAAAFLIANTSRPPVDVMIIECGMGGLRDATNVIPPGLVLASGLTSVGLDHTDRLGDTITKIAREKASICVRDVALVVAPHLHPDALAAAHAVSHERHAIAIEASPSQATEPPTPMSLNPFHPPGPVSVRTPLRGAGGGMLYTHLSLGGAHQLDNLSLALTLLDVIRNDKRARTIQPKLRGLTDMALQQGVHAAKWQGRCEWLAWNDPQSNRQIPFLVDGAHNTDSAVTLRAYLDSLGVPGPRTFVVALSASPGKDPAGVLGPLLRPGDRVALARFTTPVDGMPWIQCADAGALGAAAAPLVGESGQVYTVPEAGPAAVADGLRWAAWGNHGLTVVCGSLYLVADAYRLVAGQ